MNPYYQDNHIRIFNKDCRSTDELLEESVQMVCTSPPYWGLRKYSGEQDLIWGGDNHCEHEWGETIKLGEGYSGSKRWQHLGGRVDEAKHWDKSIGNTAICSLCGAWKGAYGLEPNPELYVQHTTEILREIRLVLRKDGVVFWNIGDSYFGGGFGTSPGGTEDFAQRYPKQASNLGTAEHEDRKLLGSLKKQHQILKPKDLCLIPFRIAIAAQEDGWWVRSVIIWSKPNPMPESVTDRPTESHEYILMLTKNSRYYWDTEAVREQNAEPKGEGGWQNALRQGDPDRYQGKYKPHKIQGGSGGSKFMRGEHVHTGGRNIRTVWEFPTQPYPQAHFAVFPEKLPELCIKAATPEVGCCAKCGAPWERITKVSRSNESYWGKQGKTPKDVKSTGKYGDALASDGDRKRAGSDIRLGPTVSVETLGWRPTCKCNTIKPPVPSLVLDPFAGAGTTLWGAKKLNRYAVGYDISEEYCQLAVERCRQQVIL